MEKDSEGWDWEVRVSDGRASRRIRGGISRGMEGK